MTKDEALDLALEALESFAPHNGVFWRNWHKDDAEIATAITAIKQARSAPVQDIDWKDMYEKEKRRSEMWVAKYEKDIGPLEYAVPVATPVHEPVAWMDGYRNIYSLEEKAAGCPEATIPLGPIANQLANQRETSGSPVVSELHCICGAEWEWHNRDWELVATPLAAQRQWVGLTDEEQIKEMWLQMNPQSLVTFARTIEQYLKEKNT